MGRRQYEKINDDDIEEMAVLVAGMVTNVVHRPDDVSLVVDHEVHLLTIRFRTNDSDAGRVIGRQGKVISAIKTIVFAAACARNIRVELEYENDRSRNRYDD